MKLLETRIDLSDYEKVDVTLSDSETGECLSKKVELKAYLKLLSRAEDGEATVIPRLPAGTLGGVRYAGEDTFYIEVYVDADIHPTAYLNDDSIVLLPFPSLIFMTEVKSGKMVTSRVYAVKERYRAVNDGTELYMFPYGNVYQTGRICWGGNHDVFDVRSITDVELVIERFFSAVMNNDLYQQNTKRNIPLAQLIDENVKKGCFDSDTLMLMGTLGNLRNLSC